MEDQIEVEIGTNQEANDFIAYIEREQPTILDVEIPNYVMDTKYKFWIAKGYEDLFDGVIDYIQNGVKVDTKVPVNVISNETHTALFGKDVRLKIINVDIKDDLLYLWFQDGHVETLPCVYWVLAEKNLDGKFDKLEGNNHFRYIRLVKTQEQLTTIKKKFYNDIFTVNDLVENQLIHYGITLYKELSFEQLKWLSFDIETNGVTLDKHSKCLIISNTFFDGVTVQRQVFTVDEYDSEKDMILDWLEAVAIINPPVITGHNIIGFDIPYLNYIAKRNKIELTLGRDSSSIKINPRASKYRVDGSQTWEYKNIRIFGRDIVDGMFLSVKYDVGRNFPSWGLKPIIEHLGLVAEGRQFYDAAKIGENWDNLEERKKIIEYCKFDGDDSAELYKLMTPSFFYLARSIPKTLQSIVNSASGSWLNSILVRSYLQDGKSVAKKSEPSYVTGGISFGCTGIHKNCLKIDIVSMYPSIMRQWKIYDRQKDPDAVFNKMVEYYTLQRLENKQKFKETKDSYYDDLQASQKIAINSLYGLNGTSGLNYNNFKNADTITSLGRLILRATSVWATGYDVDHWFPEYKQLNHDDQYFELLDLPEFKSHKFVMVNGDTDSITFKKEDESNFTNEEIESLINEINGILPELINFENDGLFPKVVVLKAKNYVLYDGKKIKFKGSSLRNSRQEPAMKEMMDRILKDSLIYEKEDYVSIFKEYLDEAKNIKDIKRWAKKESVTETLFESNRLTETKKADAIADIGAKVGDKVFLYNAIDGEVQLSVKGELQWKKLKKKEYEDQGLIKEPLTESCTHTEKSYCYTCNPHLCSPKMVPNTILKHISNFNDDYDVDHYIKRCYDNINIVSAVIDMNKLEQLNE